MSESLNTAADLMPDEKRSSVNKQIFSAGMLMFALLAAQFQLSFNGTAAALFLPFLIFTVQAFLGGLFGWFLPLPKQIFLKSCVLLLLALNPDYFLLEPVPGIHWNGFFAGLAAGWAFREISGEPGWGRGIRDFAAGMIGSVFLSLAGMLARGSWLPCIAATILFFWSSFSWENKKRIVPVSASLALTLLLAAGFLILHPCRIQEPQHLSKLSPLENDMIFSIAHPPVNRILFLLPDSMEAPAFPSDAPLTVDVIRYGKNGTLFPRDAVRKEFAAYDIIAVKADLNSYSLITREFAGDLKEKLRRGGIVAFLTDPASFSMIYSSLSTCFTRILSVKQISFLAASDLELKPVFEKDSMLKSLEFYLFSKTDHELTPQTFSPESLDLMIPSDRNFRLEYQSGQFDSVPDRISRQILQKDHRWFLILLAGCVILYLFLRYWLAYSPGAGLWFSVFRDAFFGFLILFLLLCTRSLTAHDSGFLYSAVFLCFSLGICFSGKLPEPFKKCYRFAFLILLLFSWGNLGQTGIAGCFIALLFSVAAGLCTGGTWHAAAKQFSDGPVSGGKLNLAVLGAASLSAAAAFLLITSYFHH